MKKLVKKTKEKNSSERVSSGIPNFDRIIEGGFEKNSTNLVVGGSGSGKTILAVQFLMEGIKKGEKCLYITFEEEKEVFFKNMLEFGWDLQDLEEKGSFVFLEYTPEKVKIMLEEGGGLIESIVLKKKITRIVIDSLTSFELLFDNSLKKREAALSLFNMLRKWECTSLLTYEEEPLEVRLSDKTMEFEVDSIILVYFMRKERIRERYLEVLKMRGTGHSREIFPLHIDKKGVVMDSKPYPGKI